MSQIRADKQKAQELLIMKCWTIGDLVTNSGVSRSTISLFLNGKKNPQPATIGKICKALECKPSDILIQTEDQQRK